MQKLIRWAIVIFFMVVFFFMFWPLLLVLVGLVLVTLMRGNVRIYRGNPNNYFHYRRGPNPEDMFGSSGPFGGSYVNSERKKYCDILGVTENATLDEIKRGYRESIKAHHPDKFAKSSKADQQYHENKTKEINEAYDYLMKNTK